MKLERVVEIKDFEVTGIRYWVQFYGDKPWIIGHPSFEDPYYLTGWSTHNMSFSSPPFQTYELAEVWIEELTKKVVTEAKKMGSIPEKLKTLQGKKRIEFDETFPD